MPWECCKGRRPAETSTYELEATVPVQHLGSMWPRCSITNGVQTLFVVITVQQKKNSQSMFGVGLSALHVSGLRLGDGGAVKVMQEGREEQNGRSSCPGRQAQLSPIVESHWSAAVVFGLDRCHGGVGRKSVDLRSRQMFTGERMGVLAKGDGGTRTRFRSGSDQKNKIDKGKRTRMRQNQRRPD